MEIDWLKGPRDELAELFALADDSPQAIDGYRNSGLVLVAREEDEIVGEALLIAAGREVELKSLAVREDCQGVGIGRALVERAIEETRAGGATQLLVATAAADIGNLRFYQRAGFRMLRVERDAFTAQTGYPDVDVGGIRLRDRVWLSYDLAERGQLQLRVARHTDRLEEVVRFYRDGLGLTETGGFQDHAGYDGVFLDVPGTGAHLEFTVGGGHAAPAPHPESLLVLYLGDTETVQAVLARTGAAPVGAANPYWDEHAVTVEDPDGFRVVLVPERWSR